MCKFWASGPKWPPTPQTPLPDPHTYKKGVNLLRNQAAICLHSSLTRWFNTWKVLGQKLICTCFCTDHLFSAQTWPKPLLFLHSCNLCIVQYVNCNLKLIAGNLPEHTPAAYSRAFQAILWPGTQNPPPFNQITQQGCQSKGLELRNPKMYLLFAGSNPKRLWRLPQISEPPPMTTYQPTPQDQLIYIPIDSSRRQDSEYVIYIFWHKTSESYDTPPVRMNR
jgi:hypothetical protein